MRRAAVPGCSNSSPAETQSLGPSETSGHTRRKPGWC